MRGWCMEFGAPSLHSSCYIIWKTRPNTHSLSSAPKFLNFEMSRGLLDLTKSGTLYSMGLLNTVPELCHLLQVDAPLRSLSTGPGLVHLPFSLQLITLLMILFISNVLNIIYYYFPDRFLQSRHFLPNTSRLICPSANPTVSYAFPISVNGNSILLLRLSRPFFCHLYLVFIIHIYLTQQEMFELFMYCRY